MALIKCPECGKEVSDKAKSCIHCGYPFGTIYTYNDKDYDLSFLMEREWDKLWDAVMALDRRYNWELDAVSGEIVRKLYDEGKLKIKQQPSQTNIPKCPRCGSTAITAGQRGFSIVTGFWGSSATVNRCSNCGYKWKPKANSACDDYISNQIKQLHIK